MWTFKQTDEYALHTQMGINESLGEFLVHHFEGRLPEPKEIAERMDLPEDQVEMALAAVLEEGV